MTEMWILMFMCASISQCNPNSNNMASLPYHTEEQCQQAGLNTLRNAPKGMQGKVVVCIKAVTNE